MAARYSNTKQTTQSIEARRMNSCDKRPNKLLDKWLGIATIGRDTFTTFLCLILRMHHFTQSLASLCTRLALQCIICVCEKGRACIIRDRYANVVLRLIRITLFLVIEFCCLMLTLCSVLFLVYWVVKACKIHVVSCLQ